MRLEFVAVFAIAAVSGVMAQPPEGPRRFMRFNPIFGALDTDGDGELSKGEIKNAAKSLRRLDANKDGQITMEEVRPDFGGGQGGIEGGRRGEGGPRGGGPPVDRGNDAEKMVKTLMAFDKNGDGKLSKDELPERMQGMLERGDSNKDGFLTPDEIRAMARAQQPASGGDQRRRVDPIFAALDLNHDGVLSEEEIDAAPASLKTLDRNGDGKLTMDELRPAFGNHGPGDRRQQ